MKILLVCESSYKFESGGRVVRFLSKILKKEGHQVRLLVLNLRRDDYDLDSFYRENEIIFFPVKRNLKYRMAKLFLRTEELKRYRSILDSFNPQIVHFASFDNEKPAKFIREAKKFGAKVILQPWTMQFYCAQGFGFRAGHRCDLCITGNYLNALKKGCISFKGIPLQMERFKLHKDALSADVFLSSNSELDSLLMQYGVESEKIVRFPVPFDCSFLEIQEENEGDYYIFYGQANGHKGLTVLLEAFKNLPHLKLRIYPLSPLDLDVSGRQNIEVFNGFNWNNGLKEAIINAKAVLVPSLWASSTEYAMCEALLLQKPVVIFNVGVHRDIFQNRVNAMVAAPYDVVSYTQAILEIDTDADLRKSVADNGFKTLLEINDPKKLGIQLIGAYSKDTWREG